jgi:hypothetical protein
MTTSGAASAWVCALSAKERRLSIGIGRCRRSIQVYLPIQYTSIHRPFPSTRINRSHFECLTSNGRPAGSSSEFTHVENEQLRCLSVAAESTCSAIHATPS